MIYYDTEGPTVGIEPWSSPELQFWIILPWDIL